MSLLPALSGLTIVAVHGEERGNVLLEVEDAGRLYVLKLYRARSGWPGEVSRALSHRLFEGKRGTSPGARCETERASLALWREVGLDVPEVLDRPLPEGVDPPALWLEHVAGGTLQARLYEAPAGERRPLLVRLGRTLCRRHALAEALDDPLLAQEHGTVKHILVGGERFVTFDLENGYRAGYPVRTALATELSSYLRSVAKIVGEPSLDDAFAAIAEGYEARDLLLAICRHAVHGRGVVGAARVLRDRLRGKRHAKTEVTRRLLALLERG